MKGKAKIDFEQWYVAKFRSDKKIPKTANPDLINFFYTLHTEFQQGVYLSFFRERGIFIKIFPCYPNNLESDWYFILRGKDINEEESGFPDYSTAFTHAIDKACEIYNGKGE